MQPTTASNGPQALGALHESAAAGRPFTLARRITTDRTFACVRLLLPSSGAQLPAAELQAAGIARSPAKPVQQSQLMDALVELTTRTLPVTTAATAPAPAVSRPPRRSHLLLAEDNEINQSVAHGLLARLGCSADTAADGIEDLRMVEEHTCQAVLMDRHMPRMDGYAATRELRRAKHGETRACRWSR